jgi:hypothetical protein
MSRKHRADRLAILECRLDPNNWLRDEFHRFLLCGRGLWWQAASIAREQARSSAGGDPENSTKPPMMITTFK